MTIRTLFAAAALTGGALLAFAPPAQAGLEISIGFGQTYLSGRASCGCPIYSRRVCRGFDRYRRPIFASHRLPFRCGCGHKKHPPGKARGHDKHDKHGSYHKPGKHSKGYKFKHYRNAKRRSKCK